MFAFDPSENIAKEGDAVIVYEDFKTSSILKLTAQGQFDNRFGRFYHRDFIGKEYGSKISAKNGYVYMLKPTPSLITQSLPHRTQILYSVDISVIILKLDLKPGDIVVESGTGSGSLSSSLATTVGPKGFLYTFEFNEDRAIKARKEFETLGFNNIRVTWRDACQDGFLPKEGDDYQLKNVNAVFLDLPKPWEAIGHADKVLKKGGRICCFSPCIEQVQKTCLELKAKGFVDVRCFECIARNYERKKNPYKSFSKTLANRKRRGQEIEEEKAITKKEKIETAGEEGEEPTIREIEVPVETVMTEKEEKKEDNVQGSTNEPAPEQATAPQEKQTQQNKPAKTLPDYQERLYFSSGSQYSQGHTGYLTFALKL